jgi:hypothetical protein
MIGDMLSHDGSGDNQTTLVDQINTLDPGSIRTVYVLTDNPIRDTDTDAAIIDDLNVQSLISSIFPRSLFFMNKDDAAAEISWETIGSMITDYADMMLWSNSSRLLHVGLHTDHIGLSLIDKGHMISGLSFDRENVYSKELAIQRVNSSMDYNYYLLILNKFIDNMMSSYSPDVISVLPIIRDDQMGLSDTLIRKMTSPSLFFLMSSSFYQNPIQWLMAGVTIHAQKDLIGGTPIFIRNAQDDDGLIEMRFGGS